MNLRPLKDLSNQQNRIALGSTKYFTFSGENIYPPPLSLVHGSQLPPKKKIAGKTRKFSRNMVFGCVSKKPLIGHTGLGKARGKENLGHSNVRRETRETWLPAVEVDPKTCQTKRGTCILDTSFYMWMFPKMGKPPKWMVKIMETPIKLGWFEGYHYFRKHPYTTYINW